MLTTLLTTTFQRLPDNRQDRYSSKNNPAKSGMYLPFEPVFQHSGLIGAQFWLRERKDCPKLNIQKYPFRASQARLLLHRFSKYELGQSHALQPPVASLSRHHEVHYVPARTKPFTLELSQ